MSPTNVTDLDKIFPAKKKMLPPSDSAPAENVSEKNSDAANFYLGDLVISEKFTILEMKEAVFNNWEGLASSLITNADFCATGSSTPKPESPNHIRLRDMKAGKVSGPLRDDRIVGRCLLGVIDGRRISVQVLQEEEKIGADDLILSVRWASYHDHKALSHAVDLPMSRADTVKSLYTKVLGLFPSLNEAVPLERGDSEKALEGSSKAEESYDLVVPESKVISIAKGYTSGPPLTLKSSLKLTWNDPAILKEGINNCLDRPPLNLRDGSVLVVRGNADYSRAQAAMKARKLANEEMGVRPGSSAGRPGSSAGRPGSAAGGGAAAVRARMKTNNKFFENTEDTLKINGVVHTIIDSMPDRLPTGISDPSQSSASPKSIPVKLENGSEVPPASSDN